MVELQVYKLVLGKGCDLTLALTALKQLCLCLCLLLRMLQGMRAIEAVRRDCPRQKGWASGESSSVESWAA